MYIIGGTTYRGKVDVARGGLFYVVTRFEHLFYVPLLPQASFVVLQKTPSGGFLGTQIPLSWKSVLMAWLRAALAIVGIVVCIPLAIGLGDQQRDLWLPSLIVVVAAVLSLVLTYRLRFLSQASYRRALELGRLAGFSETDLLTLEVAYGR